MKVLITGGSGFIGQHLIAQLQDEFQLTVLTRSPQAAADILGTAPSFISKLPRASEFEQFDAVINLAGEPIANKRWSQPQKQAICESRWQLTKKLADAIEQCETPPIFISGSAIGFYGNQMNRLVDETTPINQQELQQDFAHKVCYEWEQQALRVAQLTRVCIVRTGLVLAPKFGALKKMLPAYRLGLGGPIGSGCQYMSWIHIQDMVALLIFLLKNPNCHGIYNATAPAPVTNQEFSQSLAEALNHPHFLTTPGFILKLALGEMAKLLLEGQRVVPARLLEAGFEFQFEQLKPALDDLL